MIAYKCCKWWNEGKLVSWSYWWMPEDSMAIYEEGETTHRKPGDGPLATFRTLKEAKEFREKMDGPGSDYPIYECEVEPSQDSKLWQVRPSGHREYNYPAAFTLFADSVKLIRKVA